MENTTQQVVSEINALQVEKPATQQWVEQVAKMIIPSLASDVDSLNGRVELADFKGKYPDSFKKLEAIYQALKQNRLVEKGKTLSDTKMALSKEMPATGSDHIEVWRLMNYFLKNSPGNIRDTYAFSQALYQQFKAGKTTVDPSLARAYPGVDVDGAYKNGVMCLLQNRATYGLDLVNYPIHQCKTIGQYFAYFYMMGVKTIEPQYFNAKAPGAITTLSAFGFNELSEWLYAPNAINEKYQSYCLDQNKLFFAMSSGASSLEWAFAQKKPEAPVNKEVAINNADIHVGSVIKPKNQISIDKATMEANKQYGITVRGDDYVMLAELNNGKRATTESGRLKPGIRVPIATLNTNLDQLTVDGRMA